MKPLSMYPCISWLRSIWVTYHIWKRLYKTKTCHLAELDLHMYIAIITWLINLKLPSLFAAWLFWTLHNKSHNMKALVILSHSWSPFLLHTYLYGKNELLWVSFLRKKSPQIIHANHMTMTTSRKLWPWPDYCKTKENVNMKLLDLCLFTFYSVHGNESTWYRL